MGESTPRQTTGVLAEIVAATRRRVEAGKAAASLETMLEQAPPSDRSLAGALKQPGLRFILEMKRRSPSRGDLRPGATVAEVASAYRGLADAVSVLTEPEFFGGSLEDLAAMRAAVDVPVLRKDFIVDPWQVVESRLHETDAVLLMLSVLDDTTARQCLAMCERLSMGALVEVHNEDELARALELDAHFNSSQIIGVNNRDLETFEVNLATTERLARRVPPDRVLVAESGIGSTADVARLAPRVDAVLVGSSLMQQGDLRGAAARLTGGRFKVCGLTRIEDAIAARDVGAWKLGAVLAPDSPRATTPEAARAMAEETGIDVASVFRGQPPAEIVDLARQAGAKTVQVHQTLDDEDIGTLRKALPGVEIWQVHSFAAGHRPRSLPRVRGDRLFLDAQVDGRSGGTGRSFDFTVVAADPIWTQAVVAGGITPGTAGEILATGPYAIDLSSSLESEPGVKDHRLLARLSRSLRPNSRKETASRKETH